MSSKNQIQPPRIEIPSPATLLAQYELRPKKSWGQCFLHQTEVVSRIVEVSRIDLQQTVVEIGAGLGTLTAELANRAAKVIAIERDRDLVAVLRDHFTDNERIEIAEANALTFDWLQFIEPVTVVGNLPYQIASPLLFDLIDAGDAITSATLMLQKELAQRICSAPGSRSYGAPSVIVQHYTELENCFVVRRGAFIPPPKVDSAIIRFVPKIDLDTPKNFRRVVHTAFGQRRKTLRKALSAQYTADALRIAFETTGIDGQLRAEALDPATFVRLARTLDDESAIGNESKG